LLETGIPVELLLSLRELSYLLMLIDK